MLQFGSLVALHMQQVFSTVISINKLTCIGIAIECVCWAHAMVPVISTVPVVSD